MVSKQGNTKVEVWPSNLRMELSYFLIYWCNELYTAPSLCDHLSFSVGMITVMMMMMMMIKICQTKNNFQNYSLIYFLKQLINDFHDKISQILFRELGR